MSYYSVSSMLRIIGVILVSAASLTLGLTLRFDGDTSEILLMHRLGVPAAIIIPLRLAVFFFTHSLNFSLRNFSFPDMILLARTQLLVSALFAASVLIFRIPEFPRSLIALDFCLSTLMFVSIAGFARFRNESLRRPWPASQKKRIVIIGAGATGAFAAKTLQSQPQGTFRPVCFLDDNPALWGSNLGQVPVKGGLSMLAEVIKTFAPVHHVMLAIPSLSSLRVRDLMLACHESETSLLRAKTFEEMAVQLAGVAERQVTTEEILDRSIEVEHPEAVRDLLRGRQVLITGAGGSIGSEIVRQLATLDVAEICLVESSERSLFEIGRELTSRYPTVKYRSILCDIRNSQRLERVVAEFRPSIVLHAAAYKHVPLSEENPFETFLTNALGTLNVIDACRSQGCERLVVISTDKAVRPTSVMGATKLIAEWLVAETLRTPNICATAVRFGNVINSTGSVIPIFKEQILNGGPVTITHPDVERYFMSVQEAVRLVLTAATVASPGEIFALDMGERLKIVDVARRLMRFYGRPDTSITFTGLRPGERLSENIWNDDEELYRLPESKIFRIRKSAIKCDYDLGCRIKEFVSENTALSPDMVRTQIFNMMSAYKSSIARH